MDRARALGPNSDILHDTLTLFNTNKKGINAGIKYF